jgi:prepilin-type N-terminal cleavage/methylation domain-containing protein
MNQKGFTLIELLVVISIISLLASLLAVATAQARINARNTARIENALQLYKAFELGLTNGNTVPSTAGDSGGTGWACVSSSCYGAFSSEAADATTTAFLAPYLSPLPSDPQDNTRLRGGFLYNSVWAGGTSPYTGLSSPVAQLFSSRWSRPKIFLLALQA